MGQVIIRKRANGLLAAAAALTLGGTLALAPTDAEGADAAPGPAVAQTTGRVTAPKEASTPPLAPGDSAPNPVDKPGHTLDFQEEFSTPDLDTDQWMPYYLPQWAEDREKSRAQFTISDGALHEFLAADTPNWSPYDGTVKISSIQTYNHKHWHKFASSAKPYRDEPVFNGYTTKYGYFEMRAKKSDVGGGGHQAWWMVGIDDTSERSANPEIDIVETFFRYPDTWAIEGYGWGAKDFFSNWHGTGWEGKKVPHGSPTAEYHTYAMDWTPDALRFYYDNELFYEFDDAPNQAMGMILGIYTDAGSGQHNDVWPKGWDVDYIRVYKKDGGYPATVSASGADRLSPGTPNLVTTVFSNWLDRPMRNVDVQLPDLPAGWTAEVVEEGGNVFSSVAPGERATTKWVITPPAEAAGTTYELRPTAAFATDCPAQQVHTVTAGRVLERPTLPSGAMKAAADSQHATSGSDGPAANTLDGDPATIWHTKWSSDPLFVKRWPHWLRLDLGTPSQVEGIAYLPRASGDNGLISDYKVQISQTGGSSASAWTDVAAGSFPLARDWQTVVFDQPVTTRFVRLLALDEHGAEHAYASAAEVAVLGRADHTVQGFPPGQRRPDTECAGQAYLEIESSTTFEPGTTVRVTTLVKNLSTAPLENVDVNLVDLPAGWTANLAEADGNVFAEIPEGQSRRTQWLVGVPGTASGAKATPKARARWTLNCLDAQTEAEAAWQVAGSSVVPPDGIAASANSAQSGFGP
ncbi:MAG: discoidin domain-containing protein, partial [Bifidobacteriaceae bacterium]|nr:discoidin domain-containing protein [Bifidobacteriaceae bacterium]